MVKKTLGWIGVLALLGSAAAFVGAFADSGNVRTPKERREVLCEIVIQRIRCLWKFGTLRDPAVSSADSADVKVTIAPANATLVKGQLVSVACGSSRVAFSEFGPDGGTLSVAVEKFPQAVKITVTVEFVPATGMAALVKDFSRQVDHGGLLLLFHAYSDETNLFLDRGPYGVGGDYLVAGLEMKRNGNKVTVRHEILVAISGEIECRSVSFPFVSEDEDDRNLSLSIFGRLQGQLPAVLTSLPGSQLRSSGVLTPVWNCSKCVLEFRPS